MVAQFNGAAQQYFQDLVATAASSLTLRFSMTKTLGAEGDASPVMTNDVRTTMLAQSTADVSLRKLVMARVFASASGAAYVVPAAIGVFLDIYARLRLVTRRATRLMLSGRVAIDTESLEVSTLREQVGGVEISPLAHALTIESPTLLVVHVDEEALEIRRYTDNDTLRVAD